MPELTCTELEIRLRPWQGSAYPIEAELDDGARFDDELDLDLAELAVLEGQPEAYGRKLFNALFVGDIRDAYSQAIAAANAQTEGRLRVRLCIDDKAPELHAVNWERLYHKRGGTLTPLATDDAIWLSRYTSLPTPEPPPLQERAARLLIAIANPERLDRFNLSPVPVADELRTLLEALKGQPVRVTVLPGRTPLPADLTGAMQAAGWEVRAGPTTLAALGEAAIDQHLLHFVGHGVFMPKTRETKLFFEEDRLVSDADMVQALSGRRSLRLAFLMACETAKRPEGGDTSFVGLGPRLVQNDVPVVVGMQRPIPIRVSAPFTRVFYQKLLALGVVDRALSQARQAIFAQDALAWSTPVLFMRLRSGRIFADPNARPAPVAPVIHQTGKVNIVGNTNTFGSIVGGNTILYSSQHDSEAATLKLSAGSPGEAAAWQTVVAGLEPRARASAENLRAECQKLMPKPARITELLAELKQLAPDGFISVVATLKATPEVKAPAARAALDKALRQ